MKGKLTGRENHRVIMNPELESLFCRMRIMRDDHLFNFKAKYVFQSDSGFLQIRRVVERKINVANTGSVSCYVDILS